MCWMNEIWNTNIRPIEHLCDERETRKEKKRDENNKERRKKTKWNNELIETRCEQCQKLQRIWTIFFFFYKNYPWTKRIMPNSQNYHFEWKQVEKNVQSIYDRSIVQKTYKWRKADGKIEDKRRRNSEINDTNKWQEEKPKQNRWFLTNFGTKANAHSNKTQKHKDYVFAFGNVTWTAQMLRDAFWVTVHISKKQIGHKVWKRWNHSRL